MDKQHINMDRNNIWLMILLLIIFDSIGLVYNYNIKNEATLKSQCVAICDNALLIYDHSSVDTCYCNSYHIIDTVKTTYQFKLGDDVLRQRFYIPKSNPTLLGWKQIQASKDTIIGKLNPELNYGSSPILIAEARSDELYDIKDNYLYSFLYFNITDSCNMPFLKIFVHKITANEDLNFECYECVGNFDEQHITYNNNNLICKSQPICSIPVSYFKYGFNIIPLANFSNIDTLMLTINPKANKDYTAIFFYSKDIDDMTIPSIYCKK